MNADRARLVLLEAAGAAGVDAADAALLRCAATVRFRLTGSVVAEVSGPELLPAAHHEVAVSTWLAANRIPAVRVASGLPSPVVVDGHAVTFWAELPAHRPGSYQQIATALRRMHRLVTPTAPHLPLTEPFRRIEGRLTGSPLISAAERDGLLGRLRQARARYAELPPGLPHAPLHGDAWAGNIVALADGSVVLRDLERVSIGPPEWDLVSTVIDHSTFGVMSGKEYRQFSEAYGHDVLGWAGYGTLLAARELRVVAFALAAAEEAPHLVGQAQLRVRALLAGTRPWPGWQPL